MIAEQQDTDSFERKQVAVFVAAQHGVSDGFDVGFQGDEVGGGDEFVLQRDEHHDKCPRSGGSQSGKQPATLQFADGVVSFTAGQQDGEYVEYDDTAGIYHDLYRSQKGISQQEVDACRAEEREQQIRCRAYHVARGHGKDGTRGDEHGKKVEYYGFKGYFHILELQIALTSNYLAASLCGAVVFFFSMTWLPGRFSVFTEVVFIFCQYLLFLSVFGLYHFTCHLDGSVGTSHLA